MGKSAKKTETRRQQTRRQLSMQRKRAWQILPLIVHPYSLLIWIGFYFGCLAILLAGAESMPYELGQSVERNITSRVPFTREDENATEKAREEARNYTPNVYTANDAPAKMLRSELTYLLTLAKLEPEEFQSKAALKGWRFEQPQAVQTVLQEYAADKEDVDRYNKMIERLVDRLSAEYIVRENESAEVRKRTPPTSILRRPGMPDIEIPTTQLQKVSEPDVVQSTADEVVTNSTIPQPLHKPITELIARILGSSSQDRQYEPLWVYNPEATLALMDEYADRVEPVLFSYQKGTPLVRADTQKILSDEDIALLKQEHAKYLELQQTDPVMHRQKLLQQLGMGVVLLVLCLGLIMYAVQYQPRILRKPARTLGLVSLSLLIIGLSRLIDYPLNLPTEFSVGLVVIAASLLTIAYNQRFAFGVGGVLAALVTLTCRGDFGLFLTQIAAMGVAVFSLNEVRSRVKIPAVGLISAICALIVSAAVGLINGEEFKYVLMHALAASLSALGAGFIVHGILPTFEKLFGIATSLTLLEWCDASRALLRRLAQEAPGTYSHSLVLSQMCEEAAESIGARGLLARVGALYHDIGKIQKSAYFVENQEARMNRHDRLSPTMSLLIIVGHVKDGLELARAYGLPRLLHQFILEHHGTTVVRYFHHAASEAAARNTRTKGKHDQVTESEFRYPGPKPGSKESAILMLCDGCEGAVRALSEPTPGRIETTVHQVVMDRLNDGQFDDCDITLRELHAVEQSLVKSLCAIHHGRIKYPKGGREDSQSAA